MLCTIAWPLRRVGFGGAARGVGFALRLEAQRQQSQPTWRLCIDRRAELREFEGPRGVRGGLPLAPSDMCEGWRAWEEFEAAGE